MLRRKLPFGAQTLPRLLQIQAALGDKPLITSGGRQMTYADAPAVAARTAGFLTEAGLRPGDRVITLLSNRIELIELWFGLSWAGAVMVPLNTALRGAPLEHAIRTATPKFIVVEKDLLPLIESVPDSVSGADAIFVVDPDEATANASVGGVKILALRRSETLPEPHPVQPSDPAAILFTSGTTGPSKGVVCPQAQFYWWGVLTGESLGIGTEDVVFTTLPMFHTNALNALWQAMLAGCTYSFMTRFSASRFWSEARDHGATVTYLLGAIAQILLKQPASATDREHRIRVALSPATPIEMVEAFRSRFGIELVEGYGSTETNYIFSNTIGSCPAGTMGRVQPGFQVRIVDENDRDLPDGTAGELLVRHEEPYSMATGYFGNAEATVEAWKDLWFRTGDRIYRDADGVYHFLDRIKDAIRRRGENISSWEVENALSLHPDVANAAAVGVKSEMTEEEVMAFVELKKGTSPTPEALVRFLEDHLAYFAIPRYWNFVTELPMTENGKVKKHVLRDEGVTDRTWDRERAGVRLGR
ncbi:ATP-dependent acyl-CoA ligase [Elongatibacter sediminis]|uniref:ATP-dependent acyl-CoA ligase n=1 Tax=Elongatibacter sediminis TaxID=3119006 RepID=A0AAW9R5Q3_9GAMM